MNLPSFIVDLKGAQAGNGVTVIVCPNDKPDLVGEKRIDDVLVKLLPFELAVRAATVDDGICR